jgi:Ca2+-binding EF-hand superfamily protein
MSMPPKSPSIKNEGGKKKGKKERPLPTSIKLLDDRINGQDRLLFMDKIDSTSLDTIADQIRMLLYEHSEELIALLSRCDDESVGRIDGASLRNAITTLGLDAPAEAVDEAFGSLEVAPNGTIAFAELRALLTRSVQHRPRLPHLRAIGGGPTRRDAGGAHQRQHRAPSDDALFAVPEQLRTALYHSGSRAVQLFRPLDENASGEVTSSEFVAGVRQLGLLASEGSIETLFAALMPRAQHRTIPTAAPTRQRAQRTSAEAAQPHSPHGAQPARRVALPRKSLLHKPMVRRLRLFARAAESPSALGDSAGGRLMYNNVEKLM